MSSSQTSSRVERGHGALSFLDLSLSSFGAWAVCLRVGLSNRLDASALSHVPRVSEPPMLSFFFTVLPVLLVYRMWRAVQVNGGAPEHR